MLFGLLVTLYIIMCLFLVLVILVQKGKSSMGLGGLGGGSQMLFGGSGGQDLFQKLTWVATAMFLAGSLVLALMKTAQRDSFKYVKQPSAPKPLTLPYQQPLKPETTTPNIPAPTGESQS